MLIARPSFGQRASARSGERQRALPVRAVTSALVLIDGPGLARRNSGADLVDGDEARQSPRTGAARRGARGALQNIGWAAVAGQEATVLHFRRSTTIAHRTCLHARAGDGIQRRP